MVLVATITAVVLKLFSLQHLCKFCWNCDAPACLFSLLSRILNKFLKLLPAFISQRLIRCQYFILSTAMAKNPAPHTYDVAEEITVRSAFFLSKLGNHHPMKSKTVPGFLNRTFFSGNHCR